MLNQWLNDLAQEEHEKTASAQFEEVLKDMDIPELRAFLDIGKEKTAFDPRLALASGARGALGGAVGGGLLGAAGGALGAEQGQRGEGAIAGLRRGAAIGAIGGGLASGIAGGVAGKGSAYDPAAQRQMQEDLIDEQLSRINAGKEPMGIGETMRKMRSRISPRDMKIQQADMAAQLASRAGAAGAGYHAGATLPDQEVAKEASAMFAAADAAGRSLAHSIAKEAKVDPEVQAAAIRGGAIGGGLEGAARGILHGGGIPGAAIGGGFGAGFGALGGRIHESDFAERHPIAGRWVAPVLVGGLGGTAGAYLGAEGARAKQRGDLEAVEQEAAAAAPGGGMAGTLGAGAGSLARKAREAKREAEAAYGSAKTASFRGAIQKLAAEGRLRTFTEKTAAMTPNDVAKVQAVSDAMKKTKGMSLQQRKQVMKGVGKAIPGGK